MSARLSGRQSPPPEAQTGAQENSPPGSGRTDAKFAPPPEYAPKAAEAHKGKDDDERMSGTAGLTSNPVHPLEEIEAAKYKKGTCN
ncbi:hypothetical protein ASPCAL00863 [Aspergillus calidoustus]|jgi:hypothetical protein|uniref:Uncharacterized protein n=1 Tax=Aspergillus calidoustus TaxID=454130 RepID=A0A0U5FPJ0_ASPCI|nr:hypothetical protein ASPCAL00863 [Aspergillus calidoustus]